MINRNYDATIILKHYNYGENMDIPDVLKGQTIRYNTPYGNMYVTVNFSEDDKPLRVSATIGKNNDTVNMFVWTMSDLISMLLQQGIKPEEIIDKLEGHRCRDGFFDSENKRNFASIVDALSHAVSTAYGEMKGLDNGIQDRNL